MIPGVAIDKQRTRPRVPTPELLERIAERLKALADATRLRILHTLGGGEVAVSDLVQQVGGTQANVSKHLAILRRLGVVAARRDGVFVYYRVIDPTALEICRTVCDALESRADDERRVLDLPR
jgi:DNA-binding transcriptional ArsR family regulator